MCVQFADLNNDSTSAEDSCASKQPLNDSIDFNSNALVEPNRETAAENGKDCGRPTSSVVCPSTSQAEAATTETELTSVAHMLDVASAENFRTLLAPSLTPPKTDEAAATSNTETDDSVSAKAVESVSETVTGDVVPRNKVHTFTDYHLIRLLLILFC